MKKQNQLCGQTGCLGFLVKVRHLISASVSISLNYLFLNQQCTLMLTDQANISFEVLKSA